MERNLIQDFKYFYVNLHIDMGKITLSLPDEAEEKLREQAKEEKRGISKQVEFLVEQHDKLKTPLITEEEREEYMQKLEELRGLE